MSHGLRRRCGSCCGCVANGELPQIGAVCDDEAVLVGQVQQADEAQVHAQVCQLARAAVIVQRRDDVLHVDHRTAASVLPSMSTTQVVCQACIQPFVCATTVMQWSAS